MEVADEDQSRPLEGWEALPVCGSSLVGFEIDGELSDQGWIAEGQIQRASVGLSSDLVSVAEVSASLSGEHLVANGIRTESEQLEVVDSFSYYTDPFFQDPLASFRWDHPTVSGGIFPAGAGRFAVAYKAEGAALAQGMVADTLRRGRSAGSPVEIEAIEVERSIDDLEAIFRQLAGIVPDWWLSVEPQFNAVAVDLGFAEPSDVARWPMTGVPDGVCRRTGDVPGDFGPQPATGDGWRLLAVTDSGLAAGPSLAATPDEFVDLWADLGVPDDIPSLDFSQEVVAAFYETRGFAPACDRVFFDGVTFENGIVSGQPRNVHPVGGGGCLAIGLPRTFVVALARSSLPSSPFILRRDTEPWSYDVEREQIEVNLNRS